ncbi:MAG: ADP-ribosylation factor-like protein [Promethearchaeota archaeon]
MPTKKEATKLNLILKFLNSDKVDINKIKDMDDILKLSISSFNFLKEQDIGLITELFNIKNIGEFAILNEESPFRELLETKSMKVKVKKILEKDPDFENRIKKAITISLIIRRIKHSDDIEGKEAEQKVIVLGLDNAGKTAIISKFGKKLGIENLAKLRPTKGLDRREIKAKGIKLMMIDFGGQKGYRDKYLRKPEKYFFQIDLLIYVIDIQSPERYDSSIEYFEKIIDILVKLEEKPYILIFLHKFDPDIREDNEVLLNIELLKSLIKTIFKSKNLDYDIFLSSIYSMLSNEPQFARFLKDMLAEDAAFTEIDTSTSSIIESKLKSLELVLERTLNAVIQLSETMMNQYNELSARINALEQKKEKALPLHVPPHAPKPIYSSAPLPPPPPPSQKTIKKPLPPRGGMSVRAAIVSELKALFAKRKSLSE